MPNAFASYTMSHCMIIVENERHRNTNGCVLYIYFLNIIILFIREGGAASAPTLSDSMPYNKGSPMNKD